MHILRSADSLRRFVDQKKKEEVTIGFVPTMGALHAGHLALVEQMGEECSCGIVSIFVNPTQFNDPQDLDKYPRPLEEDVLKLHQSSCSAVFIPEVNEVYPEDSVALPRVDLDGLDMPMEGAHRPGHFDGVAEVMTRLLQMVRPDKLFMGQKDFQQTAVVRRLISQLELPIEFVMCPTMREADGLAMSSRNVLLDDRSRMLAPLIYTTLDNLTKQAESQPIDEALINAREALSIPEFDLEYLEVVDGFTLEPVTDVAKHEYIVACCAVMVGGVRLIDNVVVKAL